LDSGTVTRQITSRCGSKVNLSGVSGNIHLAIAVLLDGFDNGPVSVGRGAWMVFGVFALLLVVMPTLTPPNANCRRHPP
jgi:hypothetical protein